MIAEIVGRLRSVKEHTAYVDGGTLTYELLIPDSAMADLHPLIGAEVRLHTLFFLDGSMATGNLVPRLVGFPTEAERDFFVLLNRVKGISTRKALRAMAVPHQQIAAAIANGDERYLVGLPEIGKRTAAQIITDLRDEVQRFVAPAAAPAPVSQLTDAQRVAIEIIVQWGDRQADAQRWVTAAVDADATLGTPDEIVRAAYRVKQRA